MAYLGNQPVVGDSTNTFKLLDNIASFTLTFDATDTDVVSIANDTLSFTNHRFVNGQKVTYTDGGGTAIGGLSDGTSYFIIKVDQNTIKLATSASNAASSTAINLTSGAAGTSHTLNVAFDGFNTKFKATHSNGTKSNVSRAAQISLSVNGVIQQPSEGSSPTLGYSIEPDSTIVFSSAPQNGDNVFGSFIGEAAPSFDITDNTVNNFTGDGSTTSFTLSKEIPSSQDVLITLDGVTQYPTDASTTRAYSVTGQTLTFTSAPADGVAIQARLIGFAGATTSEVTGFYGRTGNAALINTDDISVQNISGVGATFTANVNIGGVLTYEDVTNVDSVGLITARSGISVSGGDIKVGSATTLSQDNIFTTGIVTATTFSGAVSGTTGTFSSGLDITGNVDITDSIRHKNDTDTVIRFPSDDNIQFDTAGVERVEIKAAEVVFNDTGADTDFRVEGDGNENLFKVDAGTDRIGIGLASPQHMVHIQHATTPRLVVEDTTNNVQAQIGADNTEARIGTVSDHPISLRVNDSEKLRINTTGELGINVTPSNGEMLAITGRSGYDDIVQVTAVGDNMGARINLTSVGSGVGRLNAKNSDLALQTSGTSRLYIKSDGNIGIGDDSPTVSLSIKSTTPTIRLTDSDASGTPESEIRGGGGDLILSADRDDEKASTLIAFQTDGTERLQITSDKVMFSVDAKVAADATYDLGASGARWNDLYIANDIDIKDDGKLLLGDSDDLEIYHSSNNNSYIVNNTGSLLIKSNYAYINDADGNNFIRCEDGSYVSLHYNGSKRFETHSEGTYHYGHSTFIIGDEGESAQLILHADDGDDNVDKWKLAAAQSTGGALYLQNYASGSWESNLIAYGNGTIELYHDNSKKFETADGGIDISGWVRPTVDDYWDIGHPDYRWDDIRATNSSIVTSDRNEKEDITDTDLGLEFVNKLTPVSFKRKGKTRTHYGLIAQDVETVITDLGKTNTQFAPLIKDTLKDGSERYGLRYIELISPLVKAIQELSAKVAALEGS